MHKHFQISPPRLTIPTHPLRPPPISLSLHLVLTIRIPSVLFNGTQVASLHSVVPNSVPFFPPIGTIWCFFKRPISPALGTLKFQATLSSELIVPSPDGAQPRWKPEWWGSSHSGQLRPLLSNGPTPYPHPLRPGLRLSLCTISVSKLTYRNDSLFSSSMSTPLPLEKLNSILDLAPSP